MWSGRHIRGYKGVGVCHILLNHFKLLKNICLTIINFTIIMFLINLSLFGT